MRKTCSLFLAAFLFLMTGKRDKTAVSAAQKNREICIFCALKLLHPFRIYSDYILKKCSKTRFYSLYIPLIFCLYPKKDPEKPQKLIFITSVPSGFQAGFYLAKRKAPPITSNRSAFLCPMTSRDEQKKRYKFSHWFLNQ